MTTLDQLKPGDTARVTAVHAGGPLGQRLMALGLIDGVELRVIRHAVGGDPIEIELMGYALSLRRDEARLVEVRRGDA